jgi:hypothetical protein
VPPTLPQCLAALRAGEVVPVELRIVREPAGAGPAAARNRGASGCEADVLVFVDADVTVHPDALARIRQRFAADPDLGALFGAYDAAPAARGAVSRFRNLLHHHVHARAAGPAETFWAGLGAVRSDAFAAAGGFDAGLFPRPAVEDIELGGRLSRAGVRIELDPEVRGTHLKRWTLGSMLRTDFGARALPWIRLILAGRAPAGALNAGPRGRLDATLSLLAVLGLLARRPLTAAAALAGLAASERRLLGLLHLRGGVSLAALGMPLLVLHNLTAAAAVPVALAAHARERGGRR